jgi:acyl-CoA thioesterase FadM
MSRPTDPFVHRRAITWGDTDTAGIAYTARIPEYGLEAIEAWFRERIHLDWYAIARDQGLGTPFVHLSFDFRSPLTPRHMLATEVRLARLGGSSMTFDLLGRTEPGHAAAAPDGDRRVAFTGRLVSCFVRVVNGATEARAGMMPVMVPEAFRAALQAEAALAARATEG